MVRFPFSQTWEKGLGDVELGSSRRVGRLCPNQPDCCYTIVVDLWDTALIDSRGLSAIIQAMQRLREIGGDIALCGVLGQAKMLLDITDTYKVFKVYDTVSAFLAATQLEVSHSIDWQVSLT